MSTGVGVRPRLSDAKVGLELLSPSPHSPSPRSSRDITLDVSLSPGGGTEEGVPGEALETSEAVERAVLWDDGLGARMLSRLEGNLIHGGRTEPVLSCVSAVIGSHRFRPSSTGILSGLRMPMELDRYAIGMARLANAIIASVRKDGAHCALAKAEIDAWPFLMAAKRVTVLRVWSIKKKMQSCACAYMYMYTVA